MSVVIVCISHNLAEIFSSVFVGVFGDKNRIRYCLQYQLNEASNIGNLVALQFQHLIRTNCSNFCSLTKRLMIIVHSQQPWSLVMND